MKKAKAAEMRYLQRVTRRDRIRNEIKREEVEMEDLTKFIEQRQLGLGICKRWSMHHQIKEYGKRNQGRKGKEED